MDSIKKLIPRKILDSRKEETIEVELTTENNIIVNASVPHGKSTGKREKKYVSADEAVNYISSEVINILKDFPLNKQKELDEKLIKLDGTEDKSRIGANTILAVSYAYARASAYSLKIPLWKYISNISSTEINPNPALLVNAINGGEHGDNNLDIQEHLFVIKGGNPIHSKDLSEKLFKILITKITEKYNDKIRFGDEGGIVINFPDAIMPLEHMNEVINNETLADKVSLGIDAAANNISKTSEELFQMYIDFKKHIGNITYIEDPFKEDDVDFFKKLKESIGKTTLICGDDITTTDKNMINICGEKGAINSVIIKPNQIGSLSETIEAIKTAKTYNIKHIVSHRSGETFDDFISDLAVGTGSYGFKLGTYNQPERIAKYNRLIEIQRELT